MIALSAAAAVAIGLSLSIAAATARADESDPLPVPARTDEAAAVERYNAGVQLLLARRWSEAQAQFEQALALREGLAEAHNNLGFALRMQGPANFERALKHYDRAIALDPKLAAAYHYRAILFANSGDAPPARAEVERLRALDANLAGKLESAIGHAGGGDSGDRAGIAAQRE